jgi:hypothetical protein
MGYHFLCRNAAIAGAERGDSLVVRESAGLAAAEVVARKKGATCAREGGEDFTHGGFCGKIHRLLD